MQPSDDLGKSDGSILFLPSKWRIVAVGLILCTLVILRWQFFGVSPLLDFYGAPVVLDFVLGMLVAWIYLERRSVPIAALAVVLAASAQSSRQECSLASAAAISASSIGD